MKPNAVCRYLDLLVRIAQHNPIRTIWIDPKGKNPYYYDESFGCYRDPKGNYLSNFFFESQMVQPNIWFNTQAQ